MARSSLPRGFWKHSRGWASPIAARRIITRKAYSYIERLHRSVKEEGVWTAEYRSLEEARASIGSGSTVTTDLIAESEIALPARPFLAFTAVLNSETLTV